MAQTDSDGAPQISADALSRLTQRITSDFAKVNEQPAKGKGKGKKDKKDKKEKQERKEQDGPQKGPQRPNQNQNQPAQNRNQATPNKNQATPNKRNEKPAPKPAQKPAPKLQQHQQQRPPLPKPAPAVPAGKKIKFDDSGAARPVAPQQNLKTVRSPQRNPKNREESAPQPQPQKGKKGKKGGAKGGDKPGFDKFALLKEIIELGGNQEDLDLVTGLEDDDAKEEVVIEKNGKEKDVPQNDIAAFMKEIGLQAGKVEVVDEKAVEEELQEEEEDEDEEDEEEDEDEDMMDVDTEVEPVTDAKGRQQLLFPKRPDWHAEPLPEVNPPSEPPSSYTISKLHERAKKLLAAENEVYSSTHLVKSSDRQFLSQIMQSGTLSDKISALTLVCQESPLHTMKTLETLLGMAKKKSRSQTVQALTAIKDLFAQGVCLPPNRKLKYFAKQPALGSKDVKDIHLLVWAYEDWLKNFYFEVLKVLEALCTDQLVYARNHGVSFVYELLKEKPEQEANLLRILVNKLGDTDKKIASKVSYLLLQLQTVHPAMKGIIIGAIESDVIFKRNNSAHAQYYAVITLNQTILGTRETDVANKLLNIYFALFTAILQKDSKPVPKTKATGVNAEEAKKPQKLNRKAIARQKEQEKQTQFDEEFNAKLISAILTGVNRAFPYAKVEDDVFEKHMDTLFRITHNGNFNTSIQALMLIYQVSSSKQNVSDRFYRTLYESLLDPRLVTSSKQALYLNLLFKALKSDLSVKRVKAFIKRIIQSATFHQPSFICGVLYLIAELETTMPAIHALITEPEPNDDDEEEVFRDVPESDTEDAPAQEEKKPSAPTNAHPYDGRKRDPLHANADRTCLWELLPLLNHFHPTVAMYAQHLLEKKKMPSKPDLGMHTLSSFLDRFVYRNPKAAPPTAHGSSIMQPLAGGAGAGMVLNTRNKKAAIPLNSEQFWKKKVEEIRPEEVFFHRYFNLVQPSGKKRKRDLPEDEEEAEEAEEGDVWKALVSSRPELEGADEDDEDVDFDDDEDMDMSDMDDDDSDIPDLDDMSDAEWDTDDDDEEDGDAEGDDDDEDDEEGGVGVDAEAEFEAAMARAQAKRKEMSESEDEPAEEMDPRKKAKLENKKKKRKLKSLPTFASAEDYAAMMASDDE